MYVYYNIDHWTLMYVHYNNSLNIYERTLQRFIKGTLTRKNTRFFGSIQLNKKYFQYTSSQNHLWWKRYLDE